MDNVNYFKYLDYRELLRALLKQRKNEDARQNFGAFAASIRIEPNTFSKILNGYMHLDRDQLFLASKKLDLNAEQEKFFFLLHDWQTSSLRVRQDFLKTEIDTMRTHYYQTTAHLKATEVASEINCSDFYLDPWLQIVYAGLSIPRYQENVQQLAAELGIPEPRLTSILERLKTMGLAVQDKRTWRYVDRVLHLPRESKEYQPWRQSLCHMSLQRSALLAADQSYGYSVVFAATEDNRKAILEDFLAFLGRCQKRVRDSKEEQVYQMNFDLLPWTCN